MLAQATLPSRRILRKPRLHLDWQVPAWIQLSGGAQQRDGLRLWQPLCCFAYTQASLIPAAMDALRYSVASVPSLRYDPGDPLLPQCRVSRLYGRLVRSLRFASAFRVELCVRQIELCQYLVRSRVLRNRAWDRAAARRWLPAASACCQKLFGLLLQRFRILAECVCFGDGKRRATTQIIQENMRTARRTRGWWRKAGCAPNPESGWAGGSAQVRRLPCASSRANRAAAAFHFSGRREVFASMKSLATMSCKATGRRICSADDVFAMGQDVNRAKSFCGAGLARCESARSPCKSLDSSMPPSTHRICSVRASSSALARILFGIDSKRADVEFRPSVFRQ